MSISEPPSQLNPFATVDAFAGWQKFAEDLAVPLSQFSEAMKQQQEQIAGILRNIGRDFEQMYPRMEAASDRLADLGWTIPMLITPGFLVSLADAAYSDAEIETWLGSFYTDSNFEQLRRLETDLLTSPQLSHWKELLQDVFSAFYAGLRQVPIPALLAIIEGAVASQTGNLAAGKVNVREMAHDLEKKATPRTFECLFLRSARRYLDQLFASSNFAQSQPTQINRHWVLHGRAVGPWTQTDAVRLFVVLHTIG